MFTFLHSMCAFWPGSSEPSLKVMITVKILNSKYYKKLDGKRFLVTDVFPAILHITPSRHCPIYLHIRLAQISSNLPEVIKKLKCSEESLKTLPFLVLFNSTDSCGYFYDFCLFAYKIEFRYFFCWTLPLVSYI